MSCSKAREIDLEGFAVDPRAAEWTEFRDHYPRCADCSREVARLGALVGTLRVEASGGSAHLTEQQLVTLSTSRGQLRAEERERIAAHLAGCAPCRTELAVMTGFDWSVVTAAAKLPGWLERLGASLLPALPRPVLAAALIILVAAPAIFVWRALTDRVAEEPRLARIETRTEAPTAPTELPKASDEVVAERSEPAPQPVEIAKPVEQRRPPPEPKFGKPAPVMSAQEQPAPPQPKAEPEPRPIQIAALLPSEAPLYAPGALPGGASVRIGGESRSVGVDAPAPQVLAPEHVGRTARESPMLYWFLPKATPLAVEVTVVDPNRVEPLLETTLPGPVAAGLHGVRLAEHGVKLVPGVDHPWFVTIVVDPAQRSSDIVSGAMVRYDPLAPEPAARLAATEPARLAHAYAGAGLWYDAFDQLSSWLTAEPGASVLHVYRAALLEQVGLDEAASYERAVERPAE